MNTPYVFSIPYESLIVIYGLSNHFFVWYIN